MGGIYSFIPLIATLTNLFLTGLVLFKNIKNPVNRSFTYFSLSLVLWSLGAFMSLSATNKEMAWFACKINAGGLVFIPLTFYHFVLNITNSKEFSRKKLVWIGYLLSLTFFVLAIFTKSLFSDVVQHTWGWYPEIGITGMVFILFFFFFAYDGLFILYKARHTATDIKRNQLHYVFLGTIVGFAGGTLNAFTVTGFVFYPVGFLFNVLYTSLMVYAILTSRLLDVTVALRKAFSYVILVAIMVGIYVTGGFLYQQYLGSNVSLSIAVWMMVGATGLTIFLFSTLRENLEKGIGNLLFRGRYDYQQVLQSLGKTFVTNVDFDELTNSVVRDIGEAIGVEKGSLMFLDEEKKEFFVKSAFGVPQETARNVSFKKDDEVIRFLSRGEFFLREEIGRNPELNKIIRNQKDCKEKLETLGAYISIPIMFRGELRGILNLERKLSGHIYTGEDFRLLSILTSELAIAMENARLFKKQAETVEQLERSQNQLVETEKMVLVGQLSAGISHEIRNPLTSLIGRLKILLSRPNTDSEIKDDLEVIDKQAKRINEITENLLSFSRPSQEKKELNMNDIIDQVLNLLKYEMSAGSIKTTKVLSPLLNKIYGNPTSLQQMIVNLIHNAVESMSGKGELTIITRNADGGKEIEIMITDTGVGIPFENLKKIFKPFFTTKSGGAGLGLFIVYNIVKTHDGRISADSKPGAGTTFTISIPSSKSSAGF